MKTYTDKRAYNTIEQDVIKNFNNYIGLSKIDIHTIVIVGAYHGHEIVSLLNTYPNSNIIAFEAYYKNFNILHHNFSLEKRVKTYNIAISDVVSIEKFYELTDIGNGSLLKSTSNSKIKDVVNIQTNLLKNIVTDKIDILWVDAQGAELKILKGCDLENISSLYLEVTVREGQPPAYEGMCYLDELEDYLGQHSFILQSIGLDNEYNNGIGNSFWIKK